MARTSRHARTRSRTRNHRGGAVLRPMPWVLLASATELLRDRPYALAVEDRDRLRALVIRAGGRGINLSPRERNELLLILERAPAVSARFAAPLVTKRRHRLVG